jgi:hypothetical protein
LALERRRVAAQLFAGSFGGVLPILAVVVWWSQLPAQECVPAALAQSFSPALADSVTFLLATLGGKDGAGGQAQGSGDMAAASASWLKAVVLIMAIVLV